MACNNNFTVDIEELPNNTGMYGIFYPEEVHPQEYGAFVVSIINMLGQHRTPGHWSTGDIRNTRTRVDGDTTLAKIRRGDHPTSWSTIAGPKSERSQNHFLES